jgi:hypothetical protein
VRLRYSTRTLLIVVMLTGIAAAPVAYLTRVERRQAAAIHRIEELGGGVVGVLPKNSPLRHLPTFVVNYFKVHVIGVEGTRFDDETLCVLADINCIEQLTLVETKVTGKYLGEVPGLANCVSLTVVNSPVQPANLASSAIGPALENLHLVGESANDTMAPWLGRSRHLTHLHLENTAISDETVDAVGRLTRIESLDLRGARITDRCLKSLSGLKQLRTLVLTRTAIGDSGVADLGPLPRLILLSLKDTCVTDAGLVHLAKLPELDFLSLDGTDVTGRGLSTLKRCSKLTTLSLQRLKLDESSLGQLLELPHIQWLFLDDTNVSDSIVEILVQLPKLSGVNLRRTNVSEAGANRLQAARPQLLIDYEPANMSP